MTTTIFVSTLSGLYEALASAQGGETIALAGGNYGALTLNQKSKFSLDFPSNVTITSADPEDPAIFTRATVDRVSNLTFDGLTFDYTFQPGHVIHYRPFNFTNNENLTIRNSTFDGDRAYDTGTVSDGYGFAFGLAVTGGRGTVIENNEIFDFFRGAVFGGGQDITVRGNDIHSIRMDGMNFSHVRDVLIEENWIHDFNRAPGSGDHADFIQFWTNGGTYPSENIIIRGNHLDVGSGDATQSIFMRNDMVDRGIAGEEMFYRNILIEENLIINGHTHGITVGETAGLVIRNNSVLHSGGTAASVEIPRINLKAASTDVIVTGNAAAGVTGHTNTPAGWVVEGNALIQTQDPLAPGYYGDVFITSSLAPGEIPVALRGGLLDSLGAGATVTLAAPGEGLMPLFSASADAGNSARVFFDASATLAESGSLPPGTEFLWTFGDGSTASGLTVSHLYADPGRYDAELAVILPGHSAGIARATVPVADTALLSIKSGQLVALDPVGTEQLLSANANLGAEGLALKASGTSLSVARQHVVEMIGAEEFEINFSITAATPASRGEIFRIHGTVIATTDAQGNLNLQSFHSGFGEVKLNSKGINLADTNPHDVTISGKDGVLSITIDGMLAASTALPGPLAGTTSHGLAFGNPWGKANFVGVLDGFDLSSGSADFPPSPVSTVIVTTEEGLDAAALTAPFLEPALRMDSSYEEIFFPEEEAPADFLPELLPPI